MRWTVLSSDLLIFFPAVLYFVTAYYSKKPIGEKSSMAWHIAMVLLNPCLILIDHGHFQVEWIFCQAKLYFNWVTHLCFIFFPLLEVHFSLYCCQYNCISLGLTIAAVAAIFSDRDLVGSVFFSLALNHKQVPFYSLFMWNSILELGFILKFYLWCHIVYIESLLTV